MNIKEALAKIQELKPGCYHAVQYDYSVTKEGVGSQRCWGYIDLGGNDQVNARSDTWAEVIAALNKKLNPPQHETESIEELSL